MAYKSYRPEDFEVFVTRHENRLYRTALAIRGNASDAGAVVQEVFLRPSVSFYTLEPVVENSVKLLRSVGRGDFIEHWGG